MAISSYSSAPINTNGNTFYAWANPVSAFLKTAGWIQAPDTGQVVWPASISAIGTVTNVGGAHESFAITLDQGTFPQVGSSVTIKGCTTAGLNVTAIVTSIVGGTSFAIANASAVTETEGAGAAWASVNPQVTISSLSVTSNIITFVYAVFDGVIKAGQSIVVTGTSGGTYDGTYTILTVTPTTFTVAKTTANVGATAETAIGIVTCNFAVVSTGASTTVSLPPAASSFVYEIWQMGDGNGFPVYLRINYGSQSTVTVPNIQVLLSAGTDGAGNATGGSTGFFSVGPTASNASSFTTYMSGSTNRIHITFFGNVNAANVAGAFSAERAHDSNGNDTTSYATLVGISPANSSIKTTSISTANSTTVETKLTCVSQIGGGTGSFISNTGPSTYLCPMFPVVGAVGNPMLGLMIGKSVDWLALTQFPFTMYNTSHNYLVINNANFDASSGAITYSVITATLIMRYD